MIVWLVHNKLVVTINLLPSRLATSDRIDGMHVLLNSTKKKMVSPWKNFELQLKFRTVLLQVETTFDPFCRQFSRLNTKNYIIKVTKSCCIDLI